MCWAVINAGRAFVWHVRRRVQSMAVVRAVNNSGRDLEGLLPPKAGESPIINAGRGLFSLCRTLVAMRVDALALLPARAELRPPEGKPRSEASDLARRVVRGSLLSFITLIIIITGSQTEHPPVSF